MFGFRQDVSTDLRPSHLKKIQIIQFKIDIVLQKARSNQNRRPTTRLIHRNQVQSASFNQLQSVAMAMCTSLSSTRSTPVIRWRPTHARDLQSL